MSLLGGRDIRADQFEKAVCRAITYLMYRLSWCDQEVRRLCLVLWLSNVVKLLFRSQEHTHVHKEITNYVKETNKQTYSWYMVKGFHAIHEINKMLPRLHTYYVNNLLT